MGQLVSFILNMMINAGHKIANKYNKITNNPREEQQALLLRLLDNAKDSELGKKYDFASIKDVKEFKNRFPLTDYDFYSEYIDKLVAGEENQLTSKKTVHFNVTSGTLGQPKKIPVTEDHVKIFSKINAKYIFYIISKELGTSWTKGKGFNLAEGTYETLPTGVTVGCASSLHTARMGKILPFLKFDSMDLMYTSPIEARQPKVLGVYSRYLHARFALCEPNITYITVTFSSYLLEVLRYIEKHWKSICNDIENGTISDGVDMPKEIRESVLAKIKPNKERADELRAIFSKGFDTPVFNKVWPKVEFVVCVGGAGFQPYTNNVIDNYLGKDIHMLYLGLSASEAMISIPTKLDSPNSMFVPDTTFYEFIPIDNKGERNLRGGTRLLHELEVGKKYEVVISNVSGLFRYQMKDVIEVTGYHNSTPMMRFLNRAGYAINMFAEKTSELALQKTAEQTTKALGLDMYDYVVCPFHNKHGSNYIFMYELRNIPKDFDKALLTTTTEEFLCKANPIYKEIIEDGSCGHLEALLLQEETFMLYRDLMVLKGASAAQLKPVHVTCNPMQERFFLGLEEKDI